MKITRERPAAARQGKPKPSTARTDRTAEKREKFLSLLGETANVVRSCEGANLPRRTAYDWRREDPEFADAWDGAVELGTNALEDEAIRRAHEGVLRPVYQGKELVGHVREFS